MNTKGNDIFFRLEGQVLAAAKSCEITSSCDLIEIANPFNPDSAEYKAFISESKEWSITTNHLIANQSKSICTIQAKGTSHNGVNIGENAFVRIGKNILKFSQRGFHVVKFFLNGSYINIMSTNRYDPYDYDLDIYNMIAELEELSTNEMVAIVSCDAIKITTALQSAISQYLNIDSTFIPLVNTGYRTSFGAIGGPGYSAGSATYNTTPGSSVTTKIELIDTYAQTTRMPTSFSEGLQYVGKTFTVQFGVSGYPHSSYQGQVICTKFNITGSENSLAKGAFQFKGNGPLLPIYP